MTDLEAYIAKCEENAVPDSELNLVDMPELTEEDFSRGHFKHWKPEKKAITNRYDVDLIAWIQSAGKKGYLTRMNKVMRWAKEHGCPIERL